MKTKVNTQATATVIAPAKAFAKALQAAIAAVISGEKATSEAQAALVQAQAQSKNSVINLALVCRKAFGKKEDANSYLASVKEINAFRRSEICTIAFPADVKAVDAEIAKMKDSSTAAKDREAGKKDENPASKVTVLKIARGNAKRAKDGSLVERAKSAGDTGKAHGGHNRLSDERKLASILAIYFSEERKITAEQFATICFNEAASAGKLKTVELEKAFAAMA